MAVKSTILVGYTEKRAQEVEYRQCDFLARISA